jgi:D-glycero-D-manno-heptose 1,7-bisphosphate phosphatase
MEDDRRKPGPGMLREAMSDFEADPDETLYVGDRPEDEQAAKNAGVDFVWASEFFGD